LSATRHKSYGLILTMTVAGLISGLSTEPLDKAWNGYCVRTGGRGYWLELIIPGLVYGVAMGVCLSGFGVFNTFQRLAFIVLAGTAYFSSFCVAGVVELGARATGLWPSVEKAGVSPFSMFAAGAVGGFLVLGGAVILMRGTVAGLSPLGALYWAMWGGLWGGLLGVLGWMLAPLLDMAFWHLSSGLHMTAPIPPPPSVGSGYTYKGKDSFFYSLYAVWQTGMAVALGVLLHHYRSKAQSVEKELEKP
jgi:hypothetical protein